MKDRCGNLGGKMSGPLVSIVVPVYKSKVILKNVFSLCVLKLMKT